MSIAALDKSASKPKISVARKTQQRLFILALVLDDILALTLAFAFSYLIRFQSGLPFFEEVPVSHDQHLWLSVALLPVWLVFFAFFHLYNIHYLLGGTQEYARVFNACAVLLTLVIIGSFLLPVTRISRGWIALAWLFAFFGVTLGRFMLRRVVYGLRERGWLTSRTLIVGADGEARAVAEQLLATPTCGAEILGFVDNTSPVGSRVDGLPVVGTVETLTNLVRELDIQELVVSTSALHRNDLTEIFRAFGQSDQVELRFAPGLFEIFTTGVQVKEIGNVPLVSMNKVRLDALETAIKTVTDYVGATLLIILLSPLFFAVSLLIKRESPGPVFHRRRVTGRGGRTFDAFKFRTMFVDGDRILKAHPELEAVLRENHKLKNDPRITRIGERLRRMSFDEFPQLFNVLLGQMSLVGPRMITLEEAEKYGKWKMNLLTVKPGLTGLWQIRGRSDLSYEERVRLDMYYIRNYTLWLDFYILLQTLPAVLRGHGAY